MAESLAVKYRPKEFEDVVQQGSIIRILTRQLELEQFAHCYLFAGSSGCGKTTLTKALYNIYRRCGFNVQLMAPTAKASLRLSECTGGEARTIHKFLGLKKDDEYIYGKNDLFALMKKTQFL